MGESVIDRAIPTGGERGIAAVVGQAPMPEFAAQMAEQCRRLLDALEDPQLVAVAVAKMEGYTNKEIAAQRDCSLRTIERALELIREKWKRKSTR